jgi:hypothetical protein
MSCVASAAYKGFKYPLTLSLPIPALQGGPKKAVENVACCRKDVDGRDEARP